MPPIFEEASRALDHDLVQGRLLVNAETREERQIMGADEDVDAVNLEKTELRNRTAHPRGGDDPVSVGPVEPLRGKRDPARLSRRNLHFDRPPLNPPILCAGPLYADPTQSGSSPEKGGLAAIGDHADKPWQPLTRKPCPPAARTPRQSAETHNQTSRPSACRGCGS